LIAIALPELFEMVSLRLGQPPVNGYDHAALLRIFRPHENVAVVPLRCGHHGQLARKAEKVPDFSMGFLPPVMMTGLFLGLLLKEPDLGTAAIFSATALGMMFVGRVSRRAPAPA
jgi:hypothetical protein